MSSGSKWIPEIRKARAWKKRVKRMCDRSVGWLVGCLYSCCSHLFHRRAFSTAGFRSAYLSRSLASWLPSSEIWPLYSAVWSASRCVWTCHVSRVFTNISAKNEITFISIMFSLFRIKCSRTSMRDKKRKNQIQHNHTCTHDSQYYKHTNTPPHRYNTTQIQPWRRLNFNYEQAN